MEDDLSALENSLHHVLSRVDDEYKKGDFNYVSEVAKALTSKEGPEQKLSELNQLHQQLDSEIQKVVNENYMGFNKSISNFSDILHNLKSSQDSIAVLKKQVCKCRELLTSRSEDLGQLYSADLKQRELIRILSFVESIQQVPERLKRAIERKEYDRAVPMLNKALDKDLARQELQNIRALDEIRKDLEATKQNLVNQLLDELRENVYENLDQISVPAMKSNLVSNLKKSFDLNLDPIAESREQLTLIVATLGDMGKLDKAHAWLVQRVGDELERIVRNHVEYFAHGFTETHSGWEPLEDHMTAEESTRAMLQMPYLREMLEGLLSKLYNMMSKLEFVISAISFRNAPSDNDTPRSSYSATSPSSIPARHSNNTEDTDTDVWLDLALSPDMLRRVREGLSASASSGSYEDPAFVPAVRRFANEALGSEITSIVGNNAYDSGAVRLVTLKTVFETLVSKKIQDLEGKVAEEHRVKVLGHEFLQLAVRALGLHQGASALGINHIWKQTQVKLKQLLTELLDTDHDQQQQQQQKTFKHRQQQHHQQQQQQSKTSTNNRLRFRFEDNMEENAGRVSSASFSPNNGTHGDRNRSLTSVLPHVFCMTLYNMLSASRPISQFLSDVGQFLNNDNNMASPSSSSKNSYDINYFEEFISEMKENFVMRVKEDYTLRCRELLPQSEAFRPQESSAATMLSYRSNSAERRHIVLSVRKVKQWMQELFKFAVAVPDCKERLVEIASVLLSQLLSEATEKLHSVIRDTFAGECLLEHHHGPDWCRRVLDALQTDPVWQRIVDRHHHHHHHSMPQTGLAGPNKTSHTRTRADQLSSVLDSDSVESKNAAQIKKVIDAYLTSQKHVPNVISKTSSLIMLANLHDSLEWLSQQIDPHRALFKNNSEFETDAKDLLKRNKHYFRELSYQCLFALKLDFRARCFYFLDNIKYSSYRCEKEAHEPEGFIKEFNGELARLKRCMSDYLPEEKIHYLFEGLGALIADILIGALPKLKYNEFNEYGIAKMRRNVFALQQNITNIIPAQETHFNRVRQYYDLLKLSRSEIHDKIAENATFSLDEYKAIIKTKTPFNREPREDHLKTLEIEYQKHRRT